MRAVIVSSAAEFEDALTVRYAVFCDEQRIPREIERDQEDDVATHVVVFDDVGKPVATGRALRQLPDGQLVALSGSSTGIDEFVRIGRMAVVASARRLGLATRVLTMLEEQAALAGLRRAQLHAQISAAPFYRACGYEEHGDVFMEADIEHIEMIKPLAPPKA